MKAFGHIAKSKRFEQSLKRKTWRFFLFLLSLFCVIFITSYGIIMVRAAIENEVSDSEFTMISMSNNIKVSLDRYKEMSRQIMVNREVVEFLRDIDRGNGYKTKNARDGIISVVNTYSHVDSVYISRLDSESVHTGAGVMLIDKEILSTNEWYAPLIEAKGGNTIMINGGGAFHKQRGIPLITMARLIYDIDSQKVLGTLVVNLTTSVLNSAIKDLGGSDRLICFFDREGNILWGDEILQDSFEKQYDGSGFSWEEINDAGQRQIICAYSTEDSPIVQISISKVSMTNVQSWETVWITITLVVALVLSVFCSGAFITINITRPIDKLTEAIVNTKSDGVLHEINLSLPNNEIRRLEDSYNSMIVHVNQLIAELIEKEKSVRIAEMRTLQEQIKPHFLYNSLETISYMALESKAPKVHDALEILGSFYRNSLSKGSRYIPLRNEILIVKDYLALQKLRYGNAFDDKYELEESVLDTMVPKLILQPLVENSLYHGVRLKGEKGIIRISAFKKDEAVHICVYDTGIGMTQTKITEILSNEQTDENALSGFGLMGTLERIRYYYNYRVIINIHSEPGEYTEIEIIIPNQDKLRGGSYV